MLLGDLFKKNTKAKFVSFQVNDKSVTAVKNLDVNRDVEIPKGATIYIDGKKKVKK